MKAPLWSAEKLKDRTLKEVEQIRENAAKRSVLELVDLCDAELATRVRPQRVTRRQSTQISETDVVTGYHFVCQANRGVEANEDGTFWSGSWIVAEQNVRKSLKYGAYIALHNSKSELSYRQGRLIDYRKSARSMVSKNEEGIEFKIQPEEDPYEWVGNGAGEKGYKWSKLSSKVSHTDEEGGEHQ
jgi:hypothetical protein